MRRVLLIGGASILGRLCLRHRMSAILTRTGDEQEKQRHSNRNAVGHLLEHAGLRSVRNFRGDLDPAIHWSRMQNDRARLRAPPRFERRAEWLGPARRSFPTRAEPTSLARRV